MAIKIVDSDFQSILSVALSSKFGHSFPKQICISVNFVQIFKNSSHFGGKYPVLCAILARNSSETSFNVICSKRFIKIQ